MLSQLANIDQDTNLPVNSYDIDLPVWMTMDQSDPFADVELGSDLTHFGDRFFPDAQGLVPDGGDSGVHGPAGQVGAAQERAMADKAAADLQQQQQSKGGRKSAAKKAGGVAGAGGKGRGAKKAQGRGGGRKGGANSSSSDSNSDQDGSR